jgi:hypothetical protein
MTSDERGVVLAAIEHLLVDCHDAQVPDWENATLPAYLEALAAWLRDSDGFYANQGREVPDGWHVMADALQAATIYE